MRRLCFAVTLLCSTFLTAAAQTTGRYTLRGQLVDGVTGKPLPDLPVLILSYPPWQPAAEPLLSGPEGRFVFSGLEAGTYLAQTWLDGEPILYGEMPAGTVGATRLGPKFEEAEFTFRVRPHPAIEGTVRDEFGDPVPHVSVAGVRSQWADGRVIGNPSVRTATDDRGHYRLSPLTPGAWSVCAEFANATGNEWFQAMAPEASSVADFASREDPQFYKRSCTPGGQASSVKADWGDNLNLDVTLASAPAIAVRGHINNWQPGGMSVNMIAEDPAVSAPQPLIQNDGTFEFNVLEPGRYFLQADRRGLTDRTESSRQLVVIEKAPINGLQVTTQPVAQVSVFLQGAGLPNLPPGSVTIGLRDAGSRRGMTYWASPADDGSLKFQSLDPGAYWVLTRTEEPYCIDSIAFGARQVLHDKLTLSPGDAGRMEVALSTQCAAIEGKVVLPEGSSPGPTGVILLSGTPEAPGDVLNLNPDPDGAIAVDQLPPGRYSFWAWSQGDLSFPGPATLAEVAKRATVVEVVKGQHVSIQVPLLPLPEAK